MILSSRFLDISEPEPTVPVGTTYTITESGKWTVPATGQWQVELHGGGGCGYYSIYQTGISSGGGSGELFTTILNYGDIITVVIGKGANDSDWDGEETSFGTLSIQGGISGYMTMAGKGVGSLATDGVETTDYDDLPLAGGLGNENKPEQTYGNGGNVDLLYGRPYPREGNDGAAIITFVG